MVVTDLYQDGKAPKSARQHPMRSVVKDEGGLYDVHTPIHGPLTQDQTVQELRLKVNALELNQSILARELAVIRGYGSPFNGAVVPATVSEAVAAANSNVIPMREGRLKQHPSGAKSRAAQALVVTGNEAEALEPEPVLALPAPPSEVDDKPPALKLADTQPKHIPHPSASDTLAANDEDVHPPETKAKLAEFSDVDPDTLANLAFQYGMDLVEASEILFKEYSRREVHCYNTHDKARDDVQLSRLIRQKGIVQGAYYKSEDTLFQGWFAETQALMPMLHLRAMGSKQRDKTIRSIWRSMGYGVPLVPGEAKYREREERNRKVALLSSHPHGAYNNIEKATRLRTDGPGVTTASQIKAVRSWLGELGTRVQRGLGLTPKGTKREADGKLVLIKTPPLLSERDDPNRWHHLGLAKFQELRRWKTVRVCTQARSAWKHEELEGMDPALRMACINKQLIRRGLFTPIEVDQMFAQTLKASADLGAEQAKAIQLGRRSQRRAIAA